MSWLDELDENNDPIAPKLDYTVGDHTLDYYLAVLGAFLMLLGLFLNLGQAALAGTFFLAWTGLRRAMEYRAVKAFNRRDRPMGTLDDEGFTP